MAYYSDATIQEIEEECRVFYLDRAVTRSWNENRRGNELRLVTGWTWVQRGGKALYRTGFKTRSAALRDAYYILIQHREPPVDLSRSKVVRLDAAHTPTHKRKAA